MLSSNLHGSSSSSSAEKRSSVSENFSEKVPAVKTHFTMKRPALGDVTNQRYASVIGIRTSIAAPSKPMVPCASKTVKTKKEPITSSQKEDTSRDYLQASMTVKSSDLFLPKDASSTSTSQPNAGVAVFHDSSIVGIIYDSEVVDIDKNFKDPQVCASIAHEIYEYLRVSEESKRPSMDFMEKIQKDVNSSMRAILIDWLVEVAEEYRLLPDTLYLAVNYLDRYLSGIAMNRNRLQLLGVACMMIAAKYEEICPPKAEEFCYVTDSTYTRDQVLQMESDVLSLLKFEMTAPTARCFLKRFIIVAQQTCEVPRLQMEYLADYLAELSLLEYSMLQYTPSLIAASATFLAQFILLPRKKPWNSTLRNYTCYQASELHDCVKALHWLCCHGSYNLPAIREKYSQHKFKFVAKKYCPPSIPPELFQY